MIEFYDLICFNLGDKFISIVSLCFAFIGSFNPIQSLLRTKLTLSASNKSIVLDILNLKVNASKVNCIVFSI